MGTACRENRAVCRYAIFCREQIWPHFCIMDLHTVKLILKILHLNFTAWKERWQYIEQQSLVDCVRLVLHVFIGAFESYRSTHLCGLWHWYFDVLAHLDQQSPVVCDIGISCIYRLTECYRSSVHFFSFTNLESPSYGTFFMLYVCFYLSVCDEVKSDCKKDDFCMNFWSDFMWCVQYYTILTLSEIFLCKQRSMHYFTT